VFFRELPEGDPSLGPAGAHNVPLTPFGSMAVDPDFHALGVPMYVQTRAPGLGGDWAGLLIAQDTGGAIKGPVRGDIYFGTGPDAGHRAGTMNAPGRKWVLLPRRVAEQLLASQPLAATTPPARRG
jgi:membrane-bound lytic murein transglycosylase A